MDGDDQVLVPPAAPPLSRSQTQTQTESGSGASSNAGAPPLNPDDLEDDEDDSSMRVGARRGIKKPTQVADKSCARCRERKVRCDRSYPSCRRCRKRRETCEYPEFVYVEEAEGDEEGRLKALEDKMAILESRMPVAIEGEISGSTLSGPSKVPIIPIPTNTPFPILHPPADHVEKDLATAIYRAIVREAKPAEESQLASFLLAKIMGVTTLGKQSTDWKLALPAMARELTSHLVDCSLAACFAQLPVFKLLIKRLQPYNLETLAESSAQVAISVLCALGARSSPHSALLGIPIPSAKDASADLLRSIGERREKACRALVDLAWEKCWQLKLFWGGGNENREAHEALEAQVGLSHFMILEDIRKDETRWLVRNAMGLYQDLQYDATTDDLHDVRRNVGPLLFEGDSILAAQLRKPCMISHTQLTAYFDPKGTLTLDSLDVLKAKDSLTAMIESLLTRRIDKADIEDALNGVSTWTNSAQRCFALLATGRRPGVETSLEAVRVLWRVIDDIHATIQRLQHVLVNLDHFPEGLDPNDKFAVDRYVLLGVRIDSRLVDLCNLAHGFLLDRGSSILVDEELRMLLMESDMRIRKCLKLSAFYYQLFLSSTDKHMVYQLTVQLELLPNWVELACQRLGHPGGPTDAEFEVSEEELEWLAKGLQVACFYTPRAAPRLLELDTGRRSISQLRQQQSVAPILLPQSSAVDSGFVSRGQTSISSTPSTSTSAGISDPNQQAPVSQAESFSYNLDLPNGASFGFDQHGNTVSGGASPPGDSSFELSQNLSPAGHNEPLVRVPEVTNAFKGASWIALTEAWDPGRDDTVDSAEDGWT
ncbi:hypothetical protein T439DRAFT_323299 [Meredithblackwellia eburnea MCA 4105]